MYNKPVADEATAKMLTAQELVSKVEAYHPDADLDIVRHAYDFAGDAHDGQMRKSGDPYFIHPVSVAGIITELRLDVASVCAALLHDVVEDTKITSSDLDREFGTEISFLVDGVTKLSKICLLYTSPSPRDQRGSRMPSSA